MKFFLIGGLDELEPGSFGVLEPVVGKHRELMEVVSEAELVNSFCVCRDWGLTLPDTGWGMEKDIMTGSCRAIAERRPAFDILPVCALCCRMDGTTG